MGLGGTYRASPEGSGASLSRARPPSDLAGLEAFPSRAIYALIKSYDYVERRTALFQTVVTAVVSNREGVDGLEVVVQDPKDLKAEAAYLKATAKESYEQMAEARGRLLELLLLTYPSAAVPQTDGDRGGDRTPVGSGRPVPAGPLWV